MSGCPRKLCRYSIAVEIPITLSLGGSFIRMYSRPSLTTLLPTRHESSHTLAGGRVDQKRARCPRKAPESPHWKSVSILPFFSIGALQLQSETGFTGIASRNSTSFVKKARDTRSWYGTNSSIFKSNFSSNFQLDLVLDIYISFLLGSERGNSVVRIWRGRLWIWSNLH